MWCVAPAWPEHARHVAVEFVHPVIVGKRALPAVTVDAADPSPPCGAVAASGDVLAGGRRRRDAGGAAGCCAGRRRGG